MQVRVVACVHVYDGLQWYPAARANLLNLLLAVVALITVFVMFAVDSLLRLYVDFHVSVRWVSYSDRRLPLQQHLSALVLSCLMPRRPCACLFYSIFMRTCA